jgi:hypothetical protein
MKVPPRQPLMQINDRHERRAKPACRRRALRQTRRRDFRGYPGRTELVGSKKARLEKAKRAVSGAGQSGLVTLAANKKSRGYRSSRYPPRSPKKS